MPGDMFEDLFEKQAAMNKRIGYDTKSLRDDFDPLAAGKWLNDYIMAAGSENGGIGKYHVQGRGRHGGS